MKAGLIMLVVLAIHCMAAHGQAGGGTGTGGTGTSGTGTGGTGTGGTKTGGGGGAGIVMTSLPLMFVGMAVGMLLTNRH